MFTLFHCNDSTSRNTLCGEGLIFWYWGMPLHNCQIEEFLNFCALAMSSEFDFVVVLESKGLNFSKIPLKL